MTLNEIGTKKYALIHHIGGHSIFRRRLLDMGLTPGTKVQVRRKGPFQDSLVILVRSYELAIRKEDASYIEVEVMNV